MGETFTVVVVGAIALFALVGVVSWLSGASIYDQIGEGGLSGGPGDGEGGPARLASPTMDSAAARAEQELEIRQMLKARSDRRVRRGEQPLDIDAEVAKLQGHAAPSGGSTKRDPGLAEEVRQLVTARNERRARRGEPPLDVEAEVERTLRELDP
jgi:hypothetical protein